MELFGKDVNKFMARKQTVTEILEDDVNWLKISDLSDLKQLKKLNRNQKEALESKQLFSGSEFKRKAT